MSDRIAARCFAWLCALYAGPGLACALTVNGDGNGGDVADVELTLVEATGIARGDPAALSCLTQNELDQIGGETSVPNLLCGTLPAESGRVTLLGEALPADPQRLVQRGVSPEIARPVQIAQRDAATPESKRGMILGLMLPYLLILSSFLGGSYLVIDVTAGERERQSLEPLLATPAARTAIMSGKILAACAFAMLSLVLILVAFKLSLMFAPGRLRMMTLAVPVLAQMLLVLLPMVLIGTTLLTLISASVKSVKEAQSYMSVLMLLPMVPTVMLMVNPVKQQLWQFAVPFLSQNQLLLKLLRSEPISAEIWATYLASGLGLGIVLWLLAARLYHKEKLAISA